MSDEDILDPVDLPERPRRNRRTDAIRRLVRETVLTPADFIWPLFVVDGADRRVSIDSMPGCFRLSPDLVVRESREAFGLGIPAVALFPALPDDEKDPRGRRESTKPGRAAPAGDPRAEGSPCPSCSVITDVALDPYSSDGHDGDRPIDGRIDNDETLAAAGRNGAHPGGGRRRHRGPLGHDGRPGRRTSGMPSTTRGPYTETGNRRLLRPSTPRPSTDPSATRSIPRPRSGDKKTYQMDPANAREALREVRLDVDEGADIVMVKPALPYLDVISLVADEVDVPVAAYHVSGEYSMLRAAAERGWLDAEAVMMESHLAIKRAGADMILTYSAVEMARRL